MWAITSAEPWLSRFEIVGQVAYDHFGRPRIQERIFAQTDDGKFFPYVTDFVEFSRILHVKVSRDANGNIASVYTMHLTHISTAPPDPGRSVTECVSETLICLGVVILVVLAFRKSIAYSNARRRAAIGKCPVCGYDLRATPHQCPECGTPVRMD